MASIDPTNQGRWRKFYPAMLDGYRINQCSEATQLFFWRIQFLADDFGNFKSNPVVLCAMAYPEVPAHARKTPADVSQMLEELLNTKSKEGKVEPLIGTFTHRGDDFVHIMDYGWRQSAPNGKPTSGPGIPPSPWDQREARISKGKQSRAVDNKDRRSKTEEQRQKNNNSKSKEGATAAVAGVILSEREEADAKALSKRPEWLKEGHGWFDLKTARELIALRLDPATVVAVLRSAKASRATLTNAAGWVRNELTKAAAALKRGGAA